MAERTRGERARAEVRSCLAVYGVEYASTPRAEFSDAARSDSVEARAKVTSAVVHIGRVHGRVREMSQPVARRIGDDSAVSDFQPGLIVNAEIQRRTGIDDARVDRVQRWRWSVREEDHRAAAESIQEVVVCVKRKDTQGCGRWVVETVKPRYCRIVRCGVVAAIG